MGDTEQSGEGKGMLLLSPIVGRVKCICTLQETKMMSFINAKNKRS